MKTAIIEAFQFWAYLLGALFTVALLAGIIAGGFFLIGTWPVPGSLGFIVFLFVCTVLSFRLSQ